MQDFEQGFSNKIGILITNLGTPDAPDKKSLKKYLRQFLSDRRVVDYNPFLWKIILYGIILNVRPKRSARLYKSIWTEEGSPLLKNMNEIVTGLDRLFTNKNVTIRLGMRYGNPSIESALETFKKNNVYKILVLPLYPQAGSPTNSSTLDEISNVFSKWPWVPSLRFVNGYHDRADYIAALSKSIISSVSDTSTIEKLIISFHGMPFRYLKEGDPYYCFCHKTARLLANKLKLKSEQYSLAFQSRFGREEWLKPYIDEEIVKYAKNGTKKLHVISPGFSVDCLETLEEIKIQYNKLFKENGGEELAYIPCLNSSEEHLKIIKGILDENLNGWLT
jgi:ferrochelatase